MFLRVIVNLTLTQAICFGAGIKLVREIFGSTLLVVVNIHVVAWHLLTNVFGELEVGRNVARLAKNPEKYDI